MWTPSTEQCENMTSSTWPHFWALTGAVFLFAVFHPAGPVAVGATKKQLPVPPLPEFPSRVRPEMLKLNASTGTVRTLDAVFGLSNRTDVPHPSPFIFT